MKIAFIDVTATVSFGGVQTAIWQLAIALTDLGHKVDVIGGEGDIRPNLQGRNISIHVFPFKARENFPNLGGRFRKLMERRSFAKNCSQFVAKQEYDWLVLTKPFDFIWPAKMKLSPKTRYMFMSGGRDFFPGDKRLSKSINGMVACSHFNAWQIKDRFRQQPKVIFNGVNIQEFSPVNVREKRKELGFEDNEVVFGFAGRLIGLKGVSVAIEALNKDVLQKLPVKLLVIGSGPSSEPLKSQARKLGVQEKVIFQESIPHQKLPTYYNACDAGVFPSLGDEAFGISIAEAMSCELPIVASYIGGIPEVVGNEEKCGFLATPGDVDAFACAMARLTTDHSLRKAMGSSARQRICSLFTWNASAQRLLSAMESTS